MPDISTKIDEKISIYCIDTEKDAIGEILEKSDKRIKVVLEGTTLTITLTRSDLRRPYIGHAAEMEFETFGILED